MNHDSDADVTVDTEAPHKSGVTDLIRDSENKSDSSVIQKLQNSSLTLGGPTQTVNSVTGLSETVSSLGSNVTSPTRDPGQSKDSAGSQDCPSSTTSAPWTKIPTTKPVAKVTPFENDCSCMLCVNTLKHSVFQPQRSERPRNQDPERVSPIERRSGSNGRRSARFTRRRPGTGIFRGVVFESDSE